jgi:hypothetical protein
VGTSYSSRQPEQVAICNCQFFSELLVKSCLGLVVLLEPWYQHNNSGLEEGFIPALAG